MKSAALWCALAGLVLACAPAVSAQTPSPHLVPFVDGPTPDPAATACPGESATLPSLSVPGRVDVRAASAANFQKYNRDGHGSFLIVMREDGAHAAVIAPTLDIDVALRNALADYSKRVAMKNPIAGCAHVASTIVVQFAMPSGDAHIEELPPAPRPPTAGVPLTTAPEFVGPTPNARASACAGEHDPGRSLEFPKKLGMTAGETAYFHAHNAVTEGIFIVTVRLDGRAAIAIAPQLDIDDATRAELIAFARRITIRPPIAGCERPATVLVGRFDPDDGAVRLARPAPPPPAPAR